MSKITDSRYITGSFILDLDHLQLLAAVTGINLLASARMFDKVPDRLHEFRLQLIAHFELEDSMMVQCGYPKIDEHRQEHILLGWMLQTLTKSELNNAEEISSVLEKVLLEHIETFDKPFVAFYNSAK